MGVLGLKEKPIVARGQDARWQSAHRLGKQVQENLVFATISPESLEYFTDLLSLAGRDILISSSPTDAGQNLVGFLEKDLHGWNM